jgi:hypothetical protein
MAVTLESRVRRMQVFHLPHEVFCRAGHCACADVTVVVVAENPRTGERAPRRTTQRVPGSLTILALERKRGLPNGVLEVADVKAAIGRGYLRVIEQTPDQPSAPPPSVPAPSSSSPAASTPAQSPPTPAPPVPSPPTPAKAPETGS